MPVIICLLRAVNLGGSNRVKMETLRTVCSSLQLRNPQTYLQSGNVIFGTPERDLAKVAQKLEKGCSREFGFKPQIILRTLEDLRDIVARNPFPKRRQIEPSKLLVSFLVSDPGEEIRKKVRAFKSEVEEIRIDGRELYIYFPNGIGRPKFSMVALEKILQMPATGRNWNSVTKMLAMAEAMESNDS